MSVQVECLAGACRSVFRNPNDPQKRGWSLHGVKPLIRHTFLQRREAPRHFGPPHVRILDFYKPFGPK